MQAAGRAAGPGRPAAPCGHAVRPPAAGEAASARAGKVTHLDGQVSCDAREPAWYRTGPPRTEKGALVVTRHADVIAAGRAERAGHLDGSLETLAAGMGRDPGDLHLLFWFAWARRPDSLAYREMTALLVPAIRAAAGWAAGMAEARAREIAFAWCGEADLVELARGVTTAVTARLTGIPAEAAGPLLAEVARASARQGPDMFDREPPEVTGYLARWMDEAGPSAPGLAGPVIAARDAGALGERDAQAALFGALAASWETTSTATAKMLLHLAAAGTPAGSGAMSRAGRRAVIEESLRVDCPFPSSWLVAARPVTIAGADVGPGTRLELRWAAACRDPAVFTGPDPAMFLPGRPAAGLHHAFGAGPHKCLGAPLARAVMHGTLAAVGPLLEDARAARVEMAAGMVDGPVHAVLALPVAAGAD